MTILRNQFKTLGKKINEFGKKTIIWLIVISTVAAMALTAYSSIASSHINYMILTLNYEGAKQGLNPDGSRFNINEIKSDEVLKEAIDMLGDKDLSVDGVKQRISIDSKMPLSAIEKTSGAIASGSNYSYNPSEFDIYYSQKKKLGKNNTVDFIHSLSKAYGEHFYNKYSEKNNILEFDGSTDYSGYDYYEITHMLTDKINSMVSYLADHQEESTTFRSTTTGYTFENLTNILLNIRDYDLKKLEAYIIQNKISKDSAGFVRKQEYLADKELLKYDSNIQASDIINEALELYDPYITGIAFIPSVDGQDEYYMSRTKTGLDNLAIKSYNKGITAKGFEEKINKCNYLADKFRNSTAPSQEYVSAADNMIADICKNLEKTSSLARLTDDEYISYKTKNYITFKLPEKGLSIPIVPFVKNWVLVAAFLLVLTMAYRFAKVKLADKIPLDAESEENTAKGEE